MQIKQVAAFQVNIPIIEDEKGRISGGREYTSALTTVVRIETDDGSFGWGESLPEGANYLPAFPGGIIPGLHEIIPALLGQNPLQIGRINEIMDATLMGHPYVKTAVDMACWDLLGKATGLPLCDLLGGRLTKKPPINAFIGRTLGKGLIEKMESYRASGDGFFMTKASGEPEKDIEFIRFVAPHMKPGERLTLDVNGGYRLDQALQVAQMTRGAAVSLEQPCESMEDCLEFGKRSGIPVLLDECIHGVQDFIRACTIGRIDGLSLKFSRFGGITKTKVIHDLCAAMGIPVTVQDSRMTNIGEAAVAHLAHATPGRILLSAWLGSGLLGVQTASGGPEVVNNRFEVSNSPGLGITPIPEVLGEPLAVWQ